MVDIVPFDHLASNRGKYFKYPLEEDLIYTNSRYISKYIKKGFTPYFISIYSLYPVSNLRFTTLLNETIKKTLTFPITILNKRSISINL
jgi:hypothetical protein